MPDGGVDPVVLLGERNRGVEAFFGPSAAADGQQRPHARGARAFEHGGAVFVKLRKIQMRVRVDDFQWNRLARAVAIRINPKSVHSQGLECASLSDLNCRDQNDRI